MIRRPLAVVLAALILACGSESTAPRTRLFELRFDVSERAITVDADSSGPLKVNCEFTLRGTVAGAGIGAWRRIELRVYTGLNRTTPVLTDTVGFAATLSAYGSLRVRDDLGARWRLSFNRPFFVAMVHFYVPEGQQREDSVSVPLACGLPSTTGSPPAPPTLSGIAVVNPGVLAAGTTMDVTYTLYAPAGAWRTDVLLRGGCAASVAFSEDLRFGVTRTVHVPIPANCPNFTTVRALVASVDAAGRGVVDTSGAVTLRDSLPPGLTLALDADATESAALFASPTLVQGGAVYLRMTAADVGTVARLMWGADPIGVRDSINLGATSDARTVRVPLPSSFVGALRARVSAVDLAGNRSTTPDQLQQVLPVQPGRVVSTILPGMISDLIADDARDRVYVLGRGIGSFTTFLLSYSATTLALIDSLPLASYTFNLLPASDGSALFAYTPQQHILRVDLTAPRLAYTTFDSAAIFDLGGGFTVALANGTLVTAVGGSTAPPVLLAMNAASGAISTRTGDPPLSGSTIVASGDGHYLFVQTASQEWTRIDAFTGQQVRVSNPAFASGIPESDADGARLRVGSTSVDVLSGTASAILLAPGTSVVPSALTPDWSAQYVAYRNGVVGVHQVTRGTMSGYLAVTPFPTSVQLSSRGRRLAMLYPINGPPGTRDAYQRLSLLTVP